MILTATKQLLELNHEQHIGVRTNHAYAEFIGRFGSAEDTKVLLDAFLANPKQRGDLLIPLMTLGNQSTAEALFQNCFTGGELMPEISEDILHCLGYIGYTQAQSVLFHYARESNWYISRAACLGLLHLPCEDIKDEITTEIKKCYGKPLFHEFIPALAIKTNDDALLEEIYQLGNTTASTDCNGGIILGVALYGERGLPYFRQIMQNPHWEAAVEATGSHHCLYIGTQYLGLSLSQLYLEMKQRLGEGANALQEFDIFHSLLYERIERPHIGLRFIQPVKESFKEIYQTLFSWSDSNHNDSLTDIASRHLGDSDDLLRGFYKLENLLRLRVEQEVVEDELRARFLQQNLQTLP
jgi:hypothetical protein